MQNFVLKFRPFTNAFLDKMTIQSETLLGAADNFKKTFPHGHILEIQPEQYAKDSNLILVDFHGLRSTPVIQSKSVVIHVDFKLRKRI